MTDSPRRKRAPLYRGRNPIRPALRSDLFDNGNHGIMLAILRGLPDADTRMLILALPRNAVRLRRTWI